MSVQDPNPLNRPDVWSLSTGGSTAAATVAYDYSGSIVAQQAITNTAGDPIAGYNRRRAEITMTMSGNRSSSPFALATSYVNRTNTSAWANGQPRTWLCTGVSGTQEAEIVGEEIVEYWKVRFSFTYNAETWDLTVPNVGLFELATGAGGTVRRRIMVEDADGNFIPAPKPVPLNPDGSAKAAGQDADLLTFIIYPQANFASQFGSPPV